MPNDIPCDACGSDARITECQTFGVGSTALALATSDPATTGGPYLAMSIDELNNGVSLKVFQASAQGTTLVGSVTLAGVLPAIAGVPDGWLVPDETPTELLVAHIDATATTVTRQALWSGAPYAASIAYGPAGRALIAWTEPTTSGPTHVAVVDASGAVVVAPFELFSTTDQPGPPSATTDGASFFVGVNGRIARIGSDGTIAAIVSGFPTIPPAYSGNPMVVSWSGTSGWYAVPQDGPGLVWEAQRFDSTGAAVGAVITIGSGARLSPPVADGTDLVAVSTPSGMTSTAYPVSLVRVPPSGTPLASMQLGVGEGDSAFVGPVARFGSVLAATWYGASKTELALVSF